MPHRKGYLNHMKPRRNLEARPVFNDCPKSHKQRVDISAHPSESRSVRLSVETRQS